MRPTSVILLVAAAAATATACNRPKPPDTQAILTKSLHGVLVYPLSTLVDASSGTDAAQVTLTSLDSVGKVASWFRQALTVNGWTLQSDVTNNDGSIAIQAASGNRPLWVTLRPNVGGPGSTYTVIGAVVSGDTLSVTDSAAAKRPAR